MAAVMSSRCLRSRSFLASTESSDGLSDEWPGEDSDGELLPLSGILVTQENRLENYSLQFNPFLFVCDKSVFNGEFVISVSLPS